MMAIRISISDQGATSRRRMGGAIGRLEKRLKRAQTPADKAAIQRLIEDARKARDERTARRADSQEMERRRHISAKALVRLKKRAADEDDPKRQAKLAALVREAEARVVSRTAPKTSAPSDTAPIDYIQGLAQRRVDLLRGQPKSVIAAQPEMYKLAGIDPRAGFDGKPPAFIPSANSRTGMRNAARDPMRKMFLAGHIEKHQYDASCEIQDLHERYDKAGMRTNGIPELIGGGKAPDVSVEVMSAVAAFRAYEQSISEAPLLRAVVIDGAPVNRLAETGLFGTRDRNALARRLKKALDEAAVFFGLLIPKAPEDEVEA